MATTQAKYDLAKAAYKDKLFSYLQESGAGKDFAKTADEAFERIAGYDPTHKMKHPHQHTYIGWMCRMILKDKPRPQDIYKIGDDLDLFRRNKAQLSKPQQNIDGYPSLKDLDLAMRPFMGLDSRNSFEKNTAAKEKALAESRVLYDGPAGKILIPLTMTASQFWGQKSRWCISAKDSENLFDKYNKHGPIIMFIPKGTGEKYAYHEREKCVRNQFDEEVKDVSPVMNDFFAKALADPSWHEKLAQDKEAVVLIQTMLLNLPKAYHELLEREVALPPSLQTKEMLGMVAHLLEDQDRYNSVEAKSDNSLFSDHAFYDPINNGEVLLHELFSNLKVIQAISAEGMEDVRAVINEGVNMNHLVTKMEDEIKESVKLTDEDLSSKAGVLAKLGPIHAKLMAFHDVASSSSSGYEDVVCKELGRMPVEVWDDPEFTRSALEITHYSIVGVKGYLPDTVFQHPDVLMEAIRRVGAVDAADYSNEGKCISPKVWGKEYNGQPMLNAVLQESLADADNHMKGVAPLRIIESVYALTRAHKEQGIDYSPLSASLAEHYPKGFSRADYLDLALSIDRVDLDAVLEATMEHHPEWFDSIPPERQTERMAMLAVSHDPEMIIETADHLLQRNPSAFQGAFNRLGLDSPIREARAHYFAGNGGNSAAPAPPPPQ